jgi:hypothetical protein
MKVKAGVTKGRNLPFRRENNLRILNRVLYVVLFQMWRRRYDGGVVISSIVRKSPMPVGLSSTLFFFDERQVRFVAFVFHSF